MPNIGPAEIIVVLVIALLVLGPKRLPEMGKSVGKGMREFKNALTTDSSDDDETPAKKRLAQTEDELAPGA